MRLFARDLGIRTATIVARVVHSKWPEDRVAFAFRLFAGPAWHATSVCVWRLLQSSRRGEARVACPAVESPKDSRRHKNEGASAFNWPQNNNNNNNHRRENPPSVGQAVWLWLRLGSALIPLSSQQSPDLLLFCHLLANSRRAQNSIHKTRRESKNQFLIQRRQGRPFFASSQALLLLLANRAADLPGAFLVLESKLWQIQPAKIIIIFAGCLPACLSR